MTVARSRVQGVYQVQAGLQRETPRIFVVAKLKPKARSWTARFAAVLWPA